MKLVILGCSLSDLEGYKEELSRLLPADLVNLSKTAGSNGLQIAKIKSYLFDTELNSEDVIIWQVTSMTRKTMRRSYPYEKYYEMMSSQFNNGTNAYYDESRVNFFDKQKRIYHLLGSPQIFDDNDEIFDPVEELQELLLTIKLVQCIHPRLLVFLGWAGAIPNDSYRNTFYDILEKKNIQHIKETYVEWVMTNNLDFWKWDASKLHPTPDSGKNFARKVLFPKLKSLGWARNNG